MSICGSGKFGVRAYGPSFLVRSWKFLHIHESTPASKGSHCKLSRIEYSPQNKRGMEMFLHPRQRSEDILISSDRQKFLYSMALCLNVENNIIGCCELSTHSRHSSMARCGGFARLSPGQFLPWFNSQFLLCVTGYK